MYDETDRSSLSAKNRTLLMISVSKVTLTFSFKGFMSITSRKNTAQCIILFYPTLSHKSISGGLERFLCACLEGTGGGGRALLDQLLECVNRIESLNCERYFREGCVYTLKFLTQGLC